MLLQKDIQKDVDYFNRGEFENAKFWSRLGGIPLLKGKKVLDVGCGHGRLCVDVALAGASKVVGLDIDTHRINFAKDNLRRNYPHLLDKVKFENIDLRYYNDSNFDIILAKDSFEHILNLDLVMAEMTKRLNQGGKIYIGFAPLYNSPKGDHGRTKIPIPWGHVFVSEQFIIQRLNRTRRQKIHSIYDLGLNKMSLADYRKLFKNSGLRTVYFQTNVSNNLIMKLFSLITKINFLEEYFTHNLYCILEKS